MKTALRSSGPAEGAVARAGGTNRSVCCVFCSRAARCAVHFSTTSRTEAAGLANPEEGRLEATAPHQPHRRPRSRLPSITEPKAAGTRPRSRTSARQSTAEEHFGASPHCPSSPHAATVSVFLPPYAPISTRWQTHTAPPPVLLLSSSALLKGEAAA
ncbi:unnamed protein product, partial [Pleuronectes platessa]